jgi:hypothetical protein
MQMATRDIRQSYQTLLGETNWEWGQQAWSPSVWINPNKEIVFGNFLE